YFVATFQIELEKETCRDSIQDIEIVQTPGLPVKLDDYFDARVINNNAKARVTVRKSPDPDTIEYFRAFTLNFRIKFDAAAAAKGCSSDGGLKITIFDSNDNAPVFEESTKTLKAEENLERALQLSVKATDLDFEKDNNGRVSFRLLDVTPKDYEPVVVLNSNGQLTIDPAKTSTRLFDRETHPKIVLNVEAMDHPEDFIDDPKIGQHKVTENIVLQVVDVNDNPPKDCRLKAPCEVNEDHPVKGTLEGCLVVCEDADVVPVFK
ncbi:MAG: cadherin repeat domain-containing protein, partial [SAR324 cluster bacterium]|nr:cadherin repeat domain-containing protein [SAR324 cluster bacterium]